jgi:hypothetical protein
MQPVARATRVLCVLAATLLVGFAAAHGAEGTAGNGVTFVNDSDHSIKLWVRYGSDASCARLPKSQELKVDAGQTVALDSGSSKVCTCLEVPSRNACAPGWNELAAGAKRHLR